MLVIVVSEDHESESFLFGSYSSLLIVLFDGLEHLAIGTLVPLYSVESQYFLVELLVGGEVFDASETLL